MGVFQPGLLIDFDCENFTVDQTINSNTGFHDLATITLTVNSPTNSVWLNAYATWTATAAADTVTLRFVRDGSVPLCSADMGVDQAGQPDTTALSCCDTGVSPGVHTYTLQAQLTHPGVGTQSVTFDKGSLQGAVINT
ncbi:hypothetical protein [Neobacillus kokaensis]|uniref:Uncharacterized protein n=1 Tax=Neobacillus kokaensis TaxID=2759023 RepID=A0ABQ3N7L1_9BACI|nr:hypothetical protein [Neobacillus kokaensis]GHH99577.1 hypothetical protein AM1BK_31200 [Neobacillus kokaensis]